MFPLEKYIYVIDGPEIKALQTYAGKVYVGRAKCAPQDEFDFEKGKALAAARCNEKIAKARYHYAVKKYKVMRSAMLHMKQQYEKSLRFLDDADEAYNEAIYDKEAVEEDLGVEFNGVED